MSPSLSPMRLAAIALWVAAAGDTVSAATLSGTIVDHESSEPLAARIYVTSEQGEPFVVQCPEGRAVPYNKRRPPDSVEVHTAVSADPFRAELPPGRYRLTVERGKEYHPATAEVTLSDDRPASVEIRLRRWTDMAARGWYSGETHVHREVSELPVLQLAEDLNVAFPLTAWVTDSAHTPATQSRVRGASPQARLVTIDDTHVFWPVNTEYEIFSVRGQRHTLGAVFVLNHREPLTLPAPPVGPIAVEARRQGAFLELDKHNWPWSMMLVPQMDVDLFELTNNHVWRTKFMFSQWYPEYVGKHMDVEMVDGKFTERGWVQFGFQTYYTLLNCGFRMRPTAGTASGVHPVPLGFGRVYVKIDGDFSYDAWVKGLLQGDSFVTTGPMLTVDASREAGTLRVKGRLESADPFDTVEVVVNGRVARRFDAEQLDAVETKAGGRLANFEAETPVDGSAWVAVRAFTRLGDGRFRFAHTAPSHFDVPDRPLRPSSAERDYLVGRVRDEVERNRAVLAPAALAEFEQALQRLRSIEAAGGER